MFSISLFLGGGFLALSLLSTHQQLEHTLNYCKHVRCCAAWTSDRVQQKVIEAGVERKQNKSRVLVNLKALCKYYG